MKNHLFIFILASMFSGYFAQAQTGVLTGKITDNTTLEIIPFATISILLNDTAITVGTSNIAGYYKIADLPQGDYIVEVRYVGYQTYRQQNVRLNNNQITFLDIQMKPSAEMLMEVEVMDYAVPLIDRDQTASGATITAEEITRMPNRNDNSVPSQPSAIRDSRSDQTTVYVAGIIADNEPQPPKVKLSIVEDDIEIEPDFNQAGLLTATELNDFGKWELWNDIQKTDLKRFQHIWKISPTWRYSVQVMSAENRPVVDAQVTLINSKDSVVWEARTDNTGRVELWMDLFEDQKDKADQIKVVFKGESFRYEKPNLFHKGINVFKIPATCETPQQIEIAFVVDATGSMDDEIEFLKTDLIDIVKHTSDQFPKSEILLGSVFYRCFSNSYATRMTPLSKNIKQTADFIGKQYAGEGGDEVVEEAFKEAIDNLGWSESARTRLLFFVLDQQPVINDGVIHKMQVYTRKAAEKGIRVIPVVASAETPHNAKSLEYLMRSIALATNGTSVFLTDHSQIGNAHATPTTDQYDVETLNRLLKRIIYQFSYVPPCDDYLALEGIADTGYIFNSPVIAHEIVDLSRIWKEIKPDKKIVDFTLKPDTALQDSTKNDQIADSITTITQEPPIKPTAIRYYPNPTSGPLTIDIQGNINELYLIDLSGKVLEKYNPRKDEKLVLNLSNYSSGIYLLKFEDANGWHSGKIIVSN
ncbi:MAG: hypothetical protein A2W85_08360 [Bacteroidetes bacterium GWF2_41_31]|nr:MAG: hypothetical protein A2W85_08360 [Bacteroidetes bacterium GWF2_41_31]OFZ03580.1 MAG: hypothetical protein A2338_03400 [Bacteroidetes bacterium RIFOXYB12_FULL_41_6]